jgi:hypothetical protein
MDRSALFLQQLHAWRAKDFEEARATSFFLSIRACPSLMLVLRDQKVLVGLDSILEKCVARPST